MPDTPTPPAPPCATEYGKCPNCGERKVLSWDVPGNKGSSCLGCGYGGATISAYPATRPATPACGHAADHQTPEGCVSITDDGRVCGATPAPREGGEFGPVVLTEADITTLRAPAPRPEEGACYRCGLPGTTKNPVESDIGPAEHDSPEGCAWALGEALAAERAAHAETRAKYDLLVVWSKAQEERAAAERARAERAEADAAGNENAYRICSAERDRLKEDVGVLPPGAHPDEARPRAESWLYERANWESEVNALRQECAMWCRRWEAARGADVERLEVEVRSLKAEMQLLRRALAPAPEGTT